MTYVRLRTEPRETAEGLRDALLFRRFRELRASDEETTRAGWTGIRSPLDTSFNDLWIGNEFAFGLRIDRWRISPVLLKAHLAEAQAVRLEETGQSKLSKTQREDVKAMVVRRLRETHAPATRFVEVVWNLPDGIVRLHAPNAIEAFTELFEATFKGSKVEPVSAYRLAERAGFGESIVGSEPSLFHLQSPRAS